MLCPAILTFQAVIIQLPQTLLTVQTAWKKQQQQKLAENIGSYSRVTLVCLVYSHLHSCDGVLLNKIYVHLPLRLKRCTRSCHSGDTVHHEAARVHQAFRPKPSVGRHPWQTPEDDWLPSSSQSSPAMSSNFFISSTYILPCSLQATFGLSIFCLLLIS